MKKLTPQKYPRRVTLTTSRMQEEVLKLINNLQHGTYKEELHYLLDSYQNLICSSNFQGGYNHFFNVYQDDTKATITNIKKCVNYYLQGKISSAYHSFNLRWNTLWNGDYIPNLHSIEKGDIWYKIRKVDKDKQPFHERKDFFHVPYDMRGMIGNNRYSISGFPCLYLGKSIYTCWEEMRRPKLAEMSSIAFKVEKPMKLLDMRLLQKIDPGEREMYNIRLLPYILASSIKVHEEGATFKPEYIIPQLILHSVIKSNAYDGVIFTSTRRDMQCNKSNIGIYDNLAIPVISNKAKGYCQELASHFYASMPAYYEYEYLKGLIHCDSPINGGQKYKDTVFYSLEEIVKNKHFDKII